MLAYAVALAASLAWGGFDAARKGLVERASPTAAAVWVNLAQGLVFLVWALATRGEAKPSYWVFGGSVFALQLAANVLLFRAFATAPLSSVVSALSLTPVFAAGTGLLFLNERFEALQWLGASLVVAGALAMHGVRVERGALLGVAVAAIWSVTTALDKLALEHASLSVHALVQSGGVGLALLLWARPAPPRGAASWFGGAVLIGCGALALQLWAVQLLFVGVVETLKRTVGLLSAVVLGRVVFKEGVTRRALAGAILMVGGTALLILGGSPL